MTIQRPRGTRDFLPDESWRRSAVREAMQEVAKRWGYQEISTPTFEDLELFTLKSGPSVVEEIYSFKDKGDRNLALRPELTAPVMRMYVSEMKNFPKPQRLYYFGNCFRYERPQKGRFREFWQFGVELIGGAKPDSEAEVIALADQMLKTVNVEGDIHVGYLGLVRSIMQKIDPIHRPAIMRMIDKKERSALKEYLVNIGADHLGLFDLIECKGDICLKKAFNISENLESLEKVNLSDNDNFPSNLKGNGRSSSRTGRAITAELKLDEFQEMIRLLEAYGVKVTIDFEIVRGLEYYSGTVFEIYAEGLGAQHQICGGGTYELASLFGGPETSSTGFGLGFDRIMEIATFKKTQKAPIFIIYAPNAKAYAIKAAAKLRMGSMNKFKNRKELPVVIDVMGRSENAQYKAAKNAGAEHVIRVERNELNLVSLTLLNLRSNFPPQENLSIEEIAEKLSEEYSCT